MSACTSYLDVFKSSKTPFVSQKEVKKLSELKRSSKDGKYVNAILFRQALISREAREFSETRRKFRSMIHFILFYSRLVVMPKAYECDRRNCCSLQVIRAFFQPRRSSSEASNRLCLRRDLRGARRSRHSRGRGRHPPAEETAGRLQHVEEGQEVGGLRGRGREVSETKKGTSFP